MSFSHNMLVTHGLSVDATNTNLAVMFRLKDLKPESNTHTFDVIDVVNLSNVNPEAHNLIMASLHMYQMLTRFGIGLTHVINEIELARLHKTIGPVFAGELTTWLQEIQQLSHMARRIALEGQAKVDEEMTKANKHKGNGPRIVKP